MMDSTSEAVAEAAPPPVTFSLGEDVVVVSDPNGVQAESISALRTHLIAKHIDEGRRGLAICACEANDLAPELATNLAVSLAQGGLRTLLIDCDLRAPRVHRYIRPSAKVPTLRDLLEDDSLGIGAAINTDILPELSVMLAGSPTANAQELLFGNRFAQMMDLCLRDFDVTIAVTPPSKWFADARHVASLLRYALVVTRKDVTMMADAKALVSELKLDGVRIVGSVYNAF